MNLDPQQVEQWLAILAKPSAGLLAFIILIIYRDAVVHLFKRIVDAIFGK